MNNRKLEIWIIGAVALLVVGVVLIQAGISKGRILATEGDAAMKDQNTINLLLKLYNEALYDAQIERTKLAIILCESDYHRNGTLRHEASGDGGRSYGIAQFQYATFKDLRTEAGRPDLRWKNRDDQLWLLDWALRHGYGSRWSCFKGPAVSAPVGAGFKPAPTRIAKGEKR